MQVRRKGSNEYPIDLKSVVDGFTVTVGDDGYGVDDPSQPNIGRARIEGMLKKRDADGRPVYYATKEPQPWSPANASTVFQPPEMLMERVWGPEQEKRLRDNLAARKVGQEEAEARVKAGLLTKGPLAAALDAGAEEKKAKAAAGAVAKPSRAKAKGGADAA